MIKHIVLWNFKEEAEGAKKEENMQIVRDRLYSLQPIIPEILSMEIGTDIGCGRDTFDMALVMTFDSVEALETYQNHPEHKAVSTFVGKVRCGRASIDFEQ